MTAWKKLICPSCQTVMGVYVWGKFQLACPNCGHAVQVRTPLKKYSEEPWLVTKSETSGEWDLYVAEFIKKHKLDELRIKHAHELLAKSKKLRDYWRHTNRAEIAKAEKAGDTEKLEHYDAITQRIFDRMLVRGLKKLIPDRPADRVAQEGG